RCVVIMPMDMDSAAAAVPMGVPMPGEHGDFARDGGIERVIPDRRLMFVVMATIVAVSVIVVMVVTFCKARAVGMRVAFVLDRHNDIEAVRLWNFFAGLPKPFPHGERKQLALARLPPCFQFYPFGRWAGQAEPGRHAVFVDG